MTLAKCPKPSLALKVRAEALTQGEHQWGSPSQAEELSWLQQVLPRSSPGRGLCLTYASPVVGESPGRGWCLGEGCRTEDPVQEGTGPVTQPGVCGSLRAEGDADKPPFCGAAGERMAKILSCAGAEDWHVGHLSSGWAE